MIYAHELTFDEMLVHHAGVNTIDGHMIAGKDRKGELSTEAGKNSAWLKWQKDVAKAKNVPANVMEYFQQTKHLAKYPKGPEDFLKEGIDYKAQTTLANKIYPPVFTWSYSSLAEFEICPYKMAASRYYKVVPYEETTATIWGSRVHEQAELFMMGKPTTDPEAFGVVEPFVKLLDKLPGERLVEDEFCINEKWQIVDGRAKAQCTAYVDLAIIHEDTVKVFDYKTGRKKDDTTQLRFYCLLFALKYPDLNKFEAKYIWLKDKVTTGFSMERKDLLGVFKELKERVGRMKQAWDEENFPMRKNGLCRQYCGATECPHCGRG